MFLLLLLLFLFLGSGPVGDDDLCTVHRDKDKLDLYVHENVRKRQIVVQVMKLNSSADRGNDYRINGGPRPNYHYHSYEPKTTKI